MSRGASPRSVCVARAPPGSKCVIARGGDEAASLLIEHKIGALPIVDGDGRVIGIVSETDCLEIAREALEHVNVEMRARA